MLPSKLIKIYSIIIDSYLINSYVFLPKITFDFLSFTQMIDREHQFYTEAIKFTMFSTGCWW